MTDRDRLRERFRTPVATLASETPERLWYDLRARRTHESLRGPQQDVLRKYEAHIAAKDVAMELPTGTGKTAVGLLIAEWRRRKFGQPVAYLTVTNQLAHQVLEESERLGIDAADLTGTAQTRSKEAEGKYRTASAVAVTHYSNLFNVVSVIQPSGLLIFDDVHGGEQYVSSMWTVRVSRQLSRDLYVACLGICAKAMTGPQLRAMDAKESRTIVLINTSLHQEVITGLSSLLNNANDDSVRYSWPLIRDHMPACVVLLSRRDLVIRPIISPTHTHAPFHDSQQRLYMSATLGGTPDLQRAYGIDEPVTIRADQAQSGRRFIFVPGLYTSDANAHRVAADIWDRLSPKRALLLAPSHETAQASFSEIHSLATTKPTAMDASQIQSSLEPFTNADGVILTLAARYDGIDLAHESCRLLIMAGSPASISEFETYLASQWKLGPVLRSRERTRLVQGLGRCTRGDTDYSVVIWLRQSLVDTSVNPIVVNGLPRDVRARALVGNDAKQD